jgi:transposase InsO family protein
MSKARVAVLHVISGQLTVTAAAKTYGLSRQHLHRLLKRYREGGLEAVDARSRRPASNPRAVPDDVIIAIVRLRESLVDQGLDAGPLTLQFHLHQGGLPVPSTSTIRRILHHHGLITPQPRKRPRSSYHRFEAAQPNQCWQSDFTHWQLADGSEVEILNWLDDHSRYLLAATAYHRVAGPDVVASFIDTINTHGLPASTLTDNGSVYTARFTHGHNEFELLLRTLGVIQKNGHPGHPQTQGKIERFHQTLKRWLTPRPRPTDLADMQTHSTPSAPSTTPSARTAPYHPAPHPRRPTPPCPKPPHPTSNPPNTSASATTPSMTAANSPSATPTAYTTSASASPMPAPKSSSWSPPPPSTSSPKQPTNSSPTTTSTPTATTGATNKNAPADGRGDL